METVITILVFLLGLSVLIVIHELGHYWAARIFGIRVEQFALFWGKKLVGFKRGDTEWRINAIPIGGYVKISGMLDESLDEEQVQGDPEPWEFRSKPIWQRLIVMFGGVIMNVVLGVIIFVGLKYAYGDKFMYNENLSWGIHVTEGTPAADLGFKTGDKLVSYNGEPIEIFDHVSDPNILMDGEINFVVDRNGKQVSISIPDDFINDFVDYEPEKRGGGLFVPAIEPILMVPDSNKLKEDMSNGSPEYTILAWKNGLRTRDKVLMVDSTKVNYYHEFQALVKDKPEQTMEVIVSRDGKQIPFQITTDTASVIGVRPYFDTLYTSLDYSLMEAIPVGARAAWNEGVVRNLQGLGKLFSGKVNPQKSLSGPVKIAKMYGKVFDSTGWRGFWAITGLLSMVLAIMNLLPIPVLDGGQILILSIEGIMGREIPAKPKMWILQISFWLVIGLMLLIVLNDIIS